MAFVERRVAVEGALELAQVLAVDGQQQVLPVAEANQPPAAWSAVSACCWPSTARRCRREVEFYGVASRIGKVGKVRLGKRQTMLRFGFKFCRTLKTGRFGVYGKLGSFMKIPRKPWHPAKNF